MMDFIFQFDEFRSDFQLKQGLVMDCPDQNKILTGLLGAQSFLRSWHRSAGQEFSRLLCNPKIHYRIYKIPTLDPTWTRWI